MLINTLFEIELPPVTMKLPFYVDSNVYYVTLSEDVVRNYVKEALKEVLGHEADQHTLNRVHHDYVCNMKPMMNCPCSIFDSLPPLTQEMTVELNEYCRPLVDLAGKRWNGEVVDTAELQKLGDEGKSKLFSSPYIEVFAYVLNDRDTIIRVYSSTLQLETQWDGQFPLIYPTFIYIDVSDRVYIIDYKKGVHVYKLSGQHLFTFGQNELVNPRSLTVSTESNSNKRFIYVIDTNSQIAKFKYSGQYVTRWFS